MASAGSLSEDERLVLRLHPHAKVLLGPATILVLILAITITVLVLLPASGASLRVRAGIGGAALVAALIWFGIPVLRWRTTTYELTNHRLRLRQGILTRSGRDFPLIRISDVSFSQGLVDRMLGCGQLVVESAGEHGQLVLTEIPHVELVQGTLFQLVEDEQARLARPEQQQ